MTQTKAEHHQARNLFRNKGKLKKHGLMRGKVPATQRWCRTCKKYTTWTYIRLYGHSRCNQCGGSFSYAKKPDEHEELLDKHDNKMRAFGKV